MTGMKTGRYAAMTLGVVLTAASLIAGGAPAVADPGPRSPALAAGIPNVTRPGNGSLLDGLSCVSAANCWAVGQYVSGAGAELNQVLHWNGTKWSQVSDPSPGGTGKSAYSELFSVRCRTATDCWAVGEYQAKNSGFLSQAQHWNGRRWSLVPTPTPGGKLSNSINELFDVVCTSATSCWAAGDYGSLSSTGLTLNLILHWNGTRWSQAATPDPAGTTSGVLNTLEAVRCTSASSCWAAGTYGTVTGSGIRLNQMLHWNGRKWSHVTTPNPGGTASAGQFSELSGLACTSAGNCWAAGAYGTDSDPQLALNQMLRWNGTAWSQVTTPEPAGTGPFARQVLSSVACTSSANCWAAGTYGNSTATGNFLNQVLHWNGTGWSFVTTPDPGGTSAGDISQLNAVRCSSAARCWAVGWVTAHKAPDGPAVNQALHWNGSTWSAR